MTCQDNLLSTGKPTPLLRNTWVILLFILLLAAFLRLVKLGQISPLGLNQDEAANAWSAYCLLKTGKDYSGAHWPIYYVRNLGGNSTPLYVYLLLPFQALGGMSIYTTRLPGALGGIFTVWLIYFVARRLFNTETGLAAAALLAVNPWHLQQTRWGHEASIAPLLGLAPLALMLWAGLPISNDKTAAPRPLIAAVAGALTGIGCFGYHSVRLFVPIFIFAAVLLNLPGWYQTLKTRKGLFAIAAFFIAFAATFGQLAYLHIFHPEGIGRHALYQPAWVGSAGLSVAIKEVASRYIQHFGPDFLFLNGDLYAIQGPPVGGQFHWYELPLMLAALLVLLIKFRSSPSLRTILAFILAYPVGDSLGWNMLSIHALRSAPGLCSLILLSAVGVVEAAKWLWKQNRDSAIITVMVFAAAVVIFNVRFFYHFYGEYNRRPPVYHMLHTDLVEACQWLRPRLDDFDAVYFTAGNFNMPYVLTAVALGYDPKRWFSEPLDVNTPGEWDIYTHYGKLYFLYDNSLLPSLKERHKNGRTLLVMRPGELNLENPGQQVLHKIVRPDGEVVLLICQL